MLYFGSKSLKPRSYFMDKSRPVLFYPALLDDLTKLTITPEYTSEQVPEIINQDEGVRTNPRVAN